MIAFKKLRLAMGLSQKDIAEDLAVSQSLVKQWERGKCSPSPERLEDIARYFNTDINTVLGFLVDKEVDFRLEYSDLELAKFKKLSESDRALVAEQFNSLVCRLAQQK